MPRERTPFWHVALVLIVAAAIIFASFFVLMPEKEDVSSLTFYTEDFPPYNYQHNGTPAGLSVDLLGEITAKMGSRVSADKVDLVPWTVGYQATEKGSKSVLFSTFRLPQRESSFKWAGPIAMDRYALFAGWDKGIEVRNASDLATYRIGVISDDAAMAQLLAVGVPQDHLVAETNVTILIQKLARGDIDLWCYPEIVGRQLSQQVMGDFYSFRIVYALGNIDCYYAFSKDVSDKLVTSFQHALDALKTERGADGLTTYERIAGRYIPSIGLANLHYLTEDWAPYNYLENGTAAGLSVDMLEAVFHALGVDRGRDDVSVVPLADALEQAKGPNSTVVFSIVKSAAREPLYKWAGPFTKSSFVLYARLSSNISITSPEQLNNYRIGAVASTIENQLLIDLGVQPSRIVNAAVPSDLLLLLANGSVDLWATGDLTGHEEMLKAGLDPADFCQVYVLSENEFYFAFSKDVPDALISAFQHAIQLIRSQPDGHGVTEYERIVYRYLGVGYARQTFSDDRVWELINTTAAAMQANVSDTIRVINAGEAPYLDPSDHGLYVFVYDMNVTLLGNAGNPLMSGVNMRGKTDVAGTPFRDLMVSGALANGTGSVDYIYMNPTMTNLYFKTTYYKLVTGSDGQQYVVCSGNYKAQS